MKTSDFDYELPKELIAQVPEKHRENARMMILNRDHHSISHEHFYNILDYLTSNDVLVLNNTKVIQARMYGKKRDTGAKIEIFLLKPLIKDGIILTENNDVRNLWEALIKPSKRVKKGVIIDISDEFSIVIRDKSENDKWLVELIYEEDKYTVNEIIKKYGTMPLPPYIERKMTSDEIKNLDKEMYQTVYANKEGSVAAPTAGLHFTEELLDKLREKGIQICYINLNVGLGTFKLVKVEEITDHKMDSEDFEVTEETAEIINKGIKEKKNIVAVGTTTIRTLETIYGRYGKIIPCQESSDLFIYPGYKFKVVNKIITNYHLPKSTLLMLVSAFASRDFVFEAYNLAIENKYHFYSYGDCMFIH